LLPAMKEEIAGRAFEGDEDVRRFWLDEHERR
jgi:hypothetical protein